MQELIRTHHRMPLSKIITLGLLLLWAGIAQAMTGASEGCFSHIDYGRSFDVKPVRALYILVDQTTPLSTKMRNRIADMVSNWGQPGDLVKVVKFSANFRDQYPELVFTGRVDPMPDQEYLYNLRWKDKNKLLECLKSQNEIFTESFKRILSTTLSSVNPEIPKTDLLYSLKQISRQMVGPDKVAKKTVLLVSDGLENSGVVSFYRKGGIKNFDRRKTFAKIRRAGLVPNWDSATIYFYGLGLPPDSKKYASMKTVDNLRLFWERYFVEGNAQVGAMGSPELLVSSIN